MSKKMQELRDIGEVELRAMIKDLDKESFAIRGELSMARKTEKPHLIKANRRKKARILTLLREKELKQEGKNG
jgi:ribosomal protein L29